jgi:hypothetical protein
VRCVIQRVRSASVSIGDELVSEIGTGLLVLAAVEKGDAGQAMRDAAKKIRELRIFSDDAGKMNRDVTRPAAPFWPSRSSRWPAPSPVDGGPASSTPRSRSGRE